MDISSVDELLTTTRAVRKRLDLTRPVGRDVILECIRLAMQAPTASNEQDWRWVVVTDADKRAAIADIYRASVPSTWPTPRPPRPIRRLGGYTKAHSASPRHSPRCPST